MIKQWRSTVRREPAFVVAVHLALLAAAAAALFVLAAAAPLALLAIVALRLAAAAIVVALRHDLSPGVSVNSGRTIR
jgi:hypothetical protein